MEPKEVKLRDGTRLIADLHDGIYRVANYVPHTPKNGRTQEYRTTGKNKDLRFAICYARGETVPSKTSREAARYLEWLLTGRGDL